MKKQCKKCKSIKVTRDFYKRKVEKDGLQSICKECWREESSLPENRKRHDESHKKWRNKPEIKERHRDRRLKSYYGISAKIYDDMLISQNNRCAICTSETVGAPGRFRVDHNHKTGKVRGLLCFKCNTMLGNANDDVNVLSAAMHYLARNA